MQRRHLLQLAAATLAVSSAAAWAQTVPVRPIKLVIAFPAGGPTDITMRQHRHRLYPRPASGRSPQIDLSNFYHR